jgi:hypothetical protein
MCGGSALALVGREFPSAAYCFAIALATTEIATLGNWRDRVPLVSRGRGTGFRFPQEGAR